MKQTAVEWLIDKLKSQGLLIGEPDNLVAFNQAKQMEKEQITDAFAECWKANVPNGIECKLDAEQYYNETFNTKNQ